VEYDYIVVGGGSAGCLAAATLAEDPAVSVLLLEHGEPAENHPEVLRADGYKDAFANDAVIWDRFSVPQPGCGGARQFMGTGMGIGGSGAVNAMVYTRGAAADWDAFAPGWRWADVQADFAAIERVLRPTRKEPTAFTEACVAAAEQAGFRRSADLNDGDLGDVLGYEWMNQEGGARRNSYVAFIKDRSPRDNLTILTGAHADRVSLDEGGRAEAVLFRHQGAALTARARREVLLAAGALETPRLLQLSGIGPGAVLRAAGVEVVREVPGVGENLHDHPNVALFFLGRRPVDCFHPQLYGFGRANPALDLPPGQSDTCYVFYPARSSIREASKRVLPGQILPPWLYRTPARALVRGALSLLWGSRLPDWVINRLFGIVVVLGKPKSRGTLRITTADPDAPARLDPAYFSDPADLATMLLGVRRARAIGAAAPLAAWGNRALSPSPRAEGDAALTRFIEKNTMTTYHFAGTCRMGEDAASVCDPRLRLRGVRGLRIVDASAIPETPVAAMNAPSMLFGYRGGRYAVEEWRGR